MFIEMCVGFCSLFCQYGGTIYIVIWILNRPVYLGEISLDHCGL